VTCRAASALESSGEHTTPGNIDANTPYQTTKYAGTHRRITPTSRVPARSQDKSPQSRGGQRSGKDQWTEGPDFVDQLAAAMAAAGDLLVVDLSQVDFLGSTGLAALVGGHRAAIVCSHATRRTVELTGYVFDVLTPGR
jgi:hypothetical protein